MQIHNLFNNKHICDIYELYTLGTQVVKFVYAYMKYEQII